MQAVVSYRSVPHILELLQDTQAATLFWKPHFTSVIHWTLRLGLGLLNQVKPLASPWLAIIDHSIDIGTKKALVVLRIRLDVLSGRVGALQRSDCECIGLQVAETVNGDSIHEALTAIFQQAGCPAGIIKDGDATLNRGVQLWRQQQTADVEVIDDISHVAARVLKKHYQDSPAYQAFVTGCNQMAKKLRQTAHAFLIPPKLRKKGRFMSISRLGEWGQKLADRLQPSRGSVEPGLAEVLPEIEQHLPFIQNFARTTQSLSQMMKVLKQQGLQAETVHACREQLGLLTDANIQATLEGWLNKHQAIQQRLGVRSLPVSSDVIESLFGSFKHIMTRNPHADMNRSVLLIPALCAGSHLDERQISTVLANTPHKTLQAWEQENIPYTLRKKRREFFHGEEPKAGKKCGQN